MADIKFEDLQGKTLTAIDGAVVGSERITFACSDGARFLMFHTQDCCEHVRVEDICGDVADLINTPILAASEESNNESDPPGAEHTNDSFTWTFYRLSTIKGTVVIRWLGESNGYYGESVDFQEMS